MLGISTPRPGIADVPDVATTKVKLAEGHFRRGVELFNEGNGEGAMIEFQRAYELAPRFSILYNMAQVAYELNDYAAAVGHFERYLQEGGSNIPQDRQDSVLVDIERLRIRTGQVHVIVDMPATVAIDDFPIGKAPLAPVVVNMGRRRISVNNAEGRTATQIVKVAAGDKVVARFSLRQLMTSHGNTEVVQEKASPNVPSDGMSTSSVVAWSLTGALGAGAALFGVLAFQNARDLDQLREDYPLNSAKPLQEKQDKVKRLSLVADSLLASASVAGMVAVALWFSSPSHDASEHAKASKVSLVPGIGSVSLSGKF